MEDRVFAHILTGSVRCVAQLQRIVGNSEMKWANCSWSWLLQEVALLERRVTVG